MTKSGVPYEPDKANYPDRMGEDIPNKDKTTVEELAPPEEFDKPVPVRIVEDDKPKQHFNDWGATKYPVEAGKKVKLLGYVPSRKRVRVLNTSSTVGIYIGPTEATDSVQGYYLSPLEDVVIESPQPLYAYNPDVAAADVTAFGAEVITTTVGTNPAAGAEVSQTVPAGERWTLKSLVVQLVTSITVASRRVSLVIDDGTNVIARITAGATQAATETRDYHFLANLGYADSAFESNVLDTGMPELVLPAGYRIRTITENLDNGVNKDDFGAPTIHYLKETSSTTVDTAETVNVALLSETVLELDRPMEKK